MALREEFGCRKGGQKHTDPDPAPEQKPAEPAEHEQEAE